jgi:hypothetical protein
VFPVPPERLWAVVADTGDYQKWWSWLRVLEGDLVEGTTARCEIRSPLPYSLRFTVSLAEVVPSRLVRADIDGDLRGPARLELDRHPDGVEARLVWEVELTRRLLRNAASVARPAMEWGHDWVVRNGVEQFCRRALGVSRVDSQR